jgi:hypothetical protein
MDGSQAPTNDYFPLLSLPDELILSVIEHIDCHEALVNFAATSSRLRDLVEPRIWRSLLVLDGDHARTIRWACESTPERMSMIHELSVRYNERNEVGIEDLAPLILQLAKLRHLTLETPCPNDHARGNELAATYLHYSRIDYTRLFEYAIRSENPTPPLSMLQSGMWRPSASPRSSC